MELHKNVLILTIHNVSVYSLKQCINSNVKILTVSMAYYYPNAVLGRKILIAPYGTKSNKTKQR